MKNAIRMSIEAGQQKVHIHQVGEHEPASSPAGRCAVEQNECHNSHQDTGNRSGYGHDRLRAPAPGDLLELGHPSQDPQRDTTDAEMVQPSDERVAQFVDQHAHKQADSRDQPEQIRPNSLRQLKGIHLQMENLGKAAHLASDQPGEHGENQDEGPIQVNRDSENSNRKAVGLLDHLAFSTIS
ncbi:MAG: hypothetical protein P8Y94_12580 [Acidobacteriota bacterium]